MFFHHYFRLTTPKGQFLYYAHKDQREASFCVCNLLMSILAGTNFLFPVPLSWLCPHARHAPEAFVFPGIHLPRKGQGKKGPDRQYARESTAIELLSVLAVQPLLNRQLAAKATS